MDTSDKYEMSPAERRRRAAARKRRQQEIKRRKRRRAILILILLLLAAAIVGGMVFAITKILSNTGDTTIAAKGSTYVIAIDPGHGGEDTGMSSAAIDEKTADLNICEKLKVMLESQGYEVVMTREDDSHLTKEERVEAANSSNADLLVSVHCNYSEEDTAISGVRVNYAAGDKESKALAENIDAALVKETGAGNQGSRSCDFVIVNDTDMPAVLVEAGYLSNESEGSSLADDVYENSVAKGIAKGVLATLNR